MTRKMPTSNAMKLRSSSSLWVVDKLPANWVRIISRVRIIVFLRPCDDDVRDKLKVLQFSIKAPTKLVLNSKFTKPTHETWCVFQGFRH